MQNNEKKGQKRKKNKIEDTVQNNFSIKWSFKLEHKGLSQENFVNKQELCMCCNGFVVLGDIYASSLHLIRNMGIFPYNNARDHHMHANNQGDHNFTNTG